MYGSKCATLVKSHTSILIREIIVSHLCEVEGVPSVPLYPFKCHHLDVQCPGGLEGGGVSKLRFTMANRSFLESIVGVITSKVGRTIHTQILYTLVSL